MKDAKAEVIERLLALSRLIRRKGTPDEAEAAVVYERQLEHDLEVRKTELTAQKDLPLHEPQEVAA